MKNSYFAIAVLSSILIQARADNAGTGAQTPPYQADLPAPTPFAVIDRAANNRVWEHYTYEKAPGGKIVAKKHQYTEMATGMHYLKDGRWVESKEQIDILPQGGAAATQGQHQVYFPGDIYKGVIQLTTPDGKQLQSRPLGISYDDGENTVLIAELTNSIGVLVSSNQVVYPNAFIGLKADLVYTYRKGGFEQDVVLWEQPPDSASFRLNPDTTKLQVLTEFFDTPEPTLRAGVADKANGLSDTTLAFGRMKMVRGKAFSIGDSIQTEARNKQISVYKSWVHLQGRTFLVEEVPVTKLAMLLEQLPVLLSANTRSAPTDSVLHKVSATQLLPSAPLVKNCTNTMLLARLDSVPKQGVVLDYVELDSGADTYTFQGDTTYLISSTVFLGTDEADVIFEGGAVIKFANTASPSDGINLSGWNDAIYQTGPYRPVIFTSKDDNSVGEPISGSSGNPVTLTNVTFLAGGIMSPSVLNYLHFRYAGIGVAIADPGPLIQNSQFIKCHRGVVQGASEVNLNNVLFSDCETCVFYSFDWYEDSWFALNCQNVTADKGNNFFDLTDSADHYYLTAYNCLFTRFSDSPIGRMTTYGVDGYFINENSYEQTNATCYQIVGSGSYYLTNGSPYRNAGTTDGNWSVANIQTKTTYPPIVYSNTTISVATTFSPQAQRDTDTPDVGYHYDPIDYFFGGVVVYSNMTFTAGTAFGWFGLPGSDWWGPGVSLDNNAVATFNGTLASPCFYACYDTVQEGCNNIWPDEGRLGGITGGGIYDPDNPSQVNAYFTHFTCLAGIANLFRDGPVGEPIRFHATDCEIYRAGGGYNPQMAFTNCLFFRSGAGQATADSQYGFEGYREIYRNCTFYGGMLEFDHWEGLPYWQVSIRDCSFDGTTFNFNPPWNDTTTNWDWTWLDTDYNATNNATFLENADLTALPGPNNVAPSGGFNWQSSWFGDFYVPTNSVVINAGDRTADTIGLYHFTTLVNQGKETNSVVDIGYHYVATDQYGNPIDSNGDGIPDYLADANGNGLVDNGEIPWNDIFSLGVLITQPRNGGTLP